MASKRPRAAYEDDQHQRSSKESSFAAYGTPLPPADPDVRDDGSYVPLWKQEVRDERGRKRFHGAFTGGFSAGYFNTVGSKEGWTPSTFVSSRTNRRKDAKNAPQQRPEDFMDEEDLADAAEGEKIQTTAGFAGLGSTETDLTRRGALVDLFRPQGETVGVRLMRKMGWREGQGVGPKVRRAARLGVGDAASTGDMAATHLFAPDNAILIRFIRKNDHKGLGFEGEERLSSKPEKDDDGEEDESSFTIPTGKPKKENKPTKGGIGIGVLNDTGSDDEDPYEIGPRISYNRVIGEKKKKKKATALGTMNPIVKDRPVFISKKKSAALSTTAPRRCHDGRLPLDGFILSSDTGLLAAIVIPDPKYLPPPVPAGWVSSKQSSQTARSTYVSTAEAAKLSTLDPKARASILGEAQLPGKSVFDYLSPAARDRIAAATGKNNLPAALGEIPQGYSLTEEEQRKELLSLVPILDQEAALEALNRGTGGWMPYAEDEEKRARYRAYLETQAGIRDGMPDRAKASSKDEWINELNEFAHCARIFKPMTGMIASRFTSASTAPAVASDAPDSSSTSLLSKPAPKVEDPAESAAKIGMFGPMTRSTADFFPTRLLCKRFGVKPPAHVQLSTERSAGDTEGTSAVFETGQQSKNLDLVSRSAIDNMLKDAGGRNTYWENGSQDVGGAVPVAEPKKDVIINAERNDALEGERAGEAVFKAIFGDDDDDDDED